MDLSALLLELEVSVPAPKRIVSWESVARVCPACTGDAARGTRRCRHCGQPLGTAD